MMLPISPRAEEASSSAGSTPSSPHSDRGVVLAQQQQDGGVHARP